MTRRSATALLLGVRAWAGPRKPLNQVIGDIPGAALLVDVRTRALLAVHGAGLAGALLVPPGSAIKPFTIEALLRGGKLRERETFACPGTLEIGTRSFNCSHPATAVPIDVRTALAYSCNCFVAHFAERFAPGELAAHLVRCGLSSRSGWLGDGEAPGRVERATTREAQQLQAIGEGGVLVTAAAMALAYRRLALAAPDAHVAGTSVAGKTGSVRTEDGAMYAWFCGFAPAVSTATASPSTATPSVVVSVMLGGRSGGADAAPVAAKILEAHFAGRL